MQTSMKKKNILMDWVCFFFNGLPITPKFLVLMFHVEQVVDSMGRSLGKEGESSGEALHHHWKRLIEGQGEVNKKESDAYIAITLRQGCPNWILLPLYV